MGLELGIFRFKCNLGVFRKFLTLGGVVLFLLFLLEVFFQTYAMYHVFVNTKSVGLVVVEVFLYLAIFYAIFRNE